MLPNSRLQAKPNYFVQSPTGLSNLAGERLSVNTPKFLNNPYPEVLRKIGHHERQMQPPPDIAHCDRMS